MTANPHLLPAIVDYIKSVIEEVTEIDSARLNETDELEVYGINSTMIFSLNAVLQRRFDDLPRTLFFEYKTIAALANYFYEHHRDAFGSADEPVVAAPEQSAKTVEVPAIVLPETVANSSEGADWFDEIPSPAITSNTANNRPVDIAIIGVSGKYPSADNLREFWSLLHDGRDAISEIPKRRWPHDAIFSEDPEAQDKVFAKWGGFIEDYDGFDHRFFNVSPKEAKKMDPQERLFLQTAWNTFEDAGYTRKALTGSRVGVYVGAMWSQYQILAAERCSLDHLEAASSSFSSIANRVSYFLNLHGPSIALDTMCSSSISAIHMACQSLASGESEMALAGGVNINSHPAKYIHLCEGKFAAKDGRCRAFGDGGSGYVPGEGVGAVLLKPLANAIADGDVIHGVIKATALNHGGKTNGYTVPNPIAQASVVEQALEKSGLQAQDISVVEAHGTGTSLGDPIEISGLLSAFGDDLDPRTRIAIGSVKTNIGHLESAAGIAGLTKILLQMRHKTLVPSLHSTQLNDNIDWHKVPFQVQQSVEPWRSRQGAPRYAALSAFGAGGSNGHLIVASAPEEAKREPITEPQLIILSAATKHSLSHMCDQLAMHCRATPQLALADLAYTLQVGRDAFAQRVAFVAESVDDAITQLEQLVSVLVAEQTDDRIGTEGSESIARLLSGSTAAQFAQQLLDAQDLSALARLWLCGADLPWADLLTTATARKVSLPGYVFDARQFNLGIPVWMAEAGKKNAQTTTAHYSVNGLNWQLFKAEAASVIPRQGVIISSSATAKTALQLKAQSVFEAFEIIDVTSFDLTNYFKSLNLKRSDDFGVISLLDLQQTAPHSPTSYYAVEQLLQIRSLLKSRCSVRYLWVNGGNTSQALVQPNAHLAAGLVQALCGEFKQFTGASLTLSDWENSAALMSTLWQGLVPAGRYRVVAQALQQLALVPLPSPAGQLAVPTDKYHVITGGTGGIGLQIAGWLAAQGANHIVLCGRQTLPPANQWPELLEREDTPVGLRQKLSQLVTLPSSVQVKSVNLTNNDEVSELFTSLHDERGLGYVFHAAGIADETLPLFTDKTSASIAQVLAPKVIGTDNLLASLARLPHEQCVLISSLASVCPRLAAGLVDYATANDYLNQRALDHYNPALEGNKPSVVSVLMPNWREVGLGETTSPHYHGLQLRSVSNQEGIALLEQALLTEMPIVLPLSTHESFDLAAVGRVAKPAITTKTSAVVTKPPAKSTPSSATNTAELIEALKTLLAPVLGMTAQEWQNNDEFAALGVDSVLLASLATVIEKWLKVPFSADLLLSNTNLVSLSGYIAEQHSEALKALSLSSLANANEAAAQPEIIKPVHSGAKVSEPEAPSESNLASAPLITQTPTIIPSASNEPIAIVGMGAIFPDSPNLERYWENLCQGHSAIREIPANRWNKDAIFNAAGKDGQSTSKWGGFVEGVENFSPSAFGLPEEIGADADPLLRLALRATDAALRDAGISTDDINGRNVGVFMGSRVSRYADRIAHYGRSSLLGVAQNFIAAHISHWLNLTGPALVIDSACSSSSLSAHMACQSLRNGECDIALAGGSEFLLDEVPYQMLSQAKALSPTGQCRTFDADANGFVPGEGSGMVVLKKLSQALIDGDRVYALISGSAVNNDGRTMGVTTPNPNAQQAVISAALANAGFSADQMGYIEAHGTGTRLGDPMELKALTQVFQQQTQRQGYCAIGSVKSNHGHLLSAAGAASLIKVALSVYHKTLVPTLNCVTPNPRFNFAQSPFFPNTKTQPWTSEDGHCRAGISAFGFGGTNVHLMVSDMHLAGAYAPVKTALPLVEHTGPYAWHPNPHLETQTSTTSNPKREVAEQPTPQPPETSAPISGAFGWQRSA